LATTIKNKSTYLLIIGFIGLIIISLQTFILIPLEKELAYHMIVEHSIFFLLGATSIKIAELFLKALVIYSKKQGNNDSKNSNIYNKKNIILKFTIFWSKLLRKIFKTKEMGFVWVIISIFILAFWHIPSIFDYSELHADIHILQHISFIIVGMTGFLSLRALGESYKIFLLLILAGMMGFIGLIFSVLDTSIFDVYSISSHNYAGTCMVVVSLVLLIVGLPLYTIKKTLSYAKAKT
jgi:hypothetical protein